MTKKVKKRILKSIISIIIIILAVILLFTGTAILHWAIELMCFQITILGIMTILIGKVAWWISGEVIDIWQ